MRSRRRWPIYSGAEAVSPDYERIPFTIPEPEPLSYRPNFSDSETLSPDYGPIPISRRSFNDQIQELKSTVSLLRYDQEKLSSTITYLRSILHNPLVSPPPFSDVVVVASDDPSALPIPANRTILASRSPVFRAMLEADMEESINRTINIGEVSHDTLGVFVRLLYAGEADLDEDLAQEILVLAEKYQISNLKTYCEKVLKSVLSWENSLPIYAFACQHGADSLRSDSLSLILKNMNMLSRRDDYAQFVERDPRMLLHIYEADYPRR